ncbi:MAG TPA: hypothetical protein HA237_01615 [Candidatus Diapherotrites archaeon]|uniref:Uncharacterized protein n=1 Tax=Candidatus Iainarchaeum sp. TaxID=3101447 RepID=A0A7J4IWD8_9ARCH|nr:hypothetical protein [Candidatus Diapherotrites archaeon]
MAKNSVKNPAFKFLLGIPPFTCMLEEFLKGKHALLLQLASENNLFLCLGCAGKAA